jgi:hypothetical protein
MLNLTLKGVDIFIKRSASKIQDSRWDNYDLVIWKQNSNGYTSKFGMFHKDSWGIADKISVNKNGIWKLPRHYVKYFK